MAAIFEGWALGQLGHSEAALEQMSRCLAELRTSGQVYWLPYFLSMQAETLAACGQIEAGLSSLAEALALVDSTGERWLEAEIHRLNGEVLHLLPRRDKQGVEDEFATALRIARSQAAKSFELRAASSLARLWAEHGERQRAHDLLSPIYGWFSEGFDTADLREAKDLLKVLMQ
jgi:predicted ATPase